VPVHGDLHEAQLLLDGGRIAGLLDVDTFGLGRRVDDLATYLGHLAVLATTMPRARSRVNAHARRLLAGFDRTVDPALLRAAVAAVVLGLATGPFRVLEPGWRAHTGTRLALAEGWLTAGPDGVRSGGAAVPHSTVPP
jgi:Ser/Thr protein kinase RdoA (MazF antagonist)